LLLAVVAIKLALMVKVINFPACPNKAITFWGYMELMLAHLNPECFNSQ